MIDKTTRNYPLPHPDNIASDDVLRIRDAISKIDEDIDIREENHSNLQKLIVKQTLENFINLWSRR